MPGSFRLALVLLTVSPCLVAGCKYGDTNAASIRRAAAPAEDVRVIEQHWPDGSLRIRRQVLQGPDDTWVNHGSYTRWYDSGGKEYQASFLDGRKHGTETRWHQNGQKHAEAHYVNGQRHGVSRTWDESGTLRKEEHHANGRPLGTWTVWDQNGNIKWQGTFDDGAPTP